MGYLQVEIPSNLDELEERTRSQTRWGEQEVLEVIEQLLNRYLAGFRTLGQSKVTYVDGRDQVWSSMTLRAFKSLRWAYHLLQRGYYSQSMTLTRSAYEDWLACMDCIENSETADALLGRGKRVPNPREMADRLPEDLKQEWKDYGMGEGLYGFLSTFAHPRHRAMTINIDPRSNTFKVVTTFEEDYFVTSSYYLLQCLLRMTEFLFRLVNPVNPHWAKELASVQHQAKEYLNRLVARKQKLLEKEYVEPLPEQVEGD